MPSWHQLRADSHQIREWPRPSACTSPSLFSPEIGTPGPGFESPYGRPVNRAVLGLGPLTLKQSDVMIERIAGGKRVPRSVREIVGARADGVPLFIEELTRSMLESSLLEESGFEHVRWIQGYDVSTLSSVEDAGRPGGPFMVIAEL